ncbi:hypothetical protein K4K55_007190 [Colletotrichum sp. SAR 10_96]|nr:hypothetical protein K4K55_007190 [Colletotrichum sp. SAR 10_96]
MSDQHDPKYLLRETKREIERLRKQHQWFQGCLDNKIVFAPVDLSDPSLKVLDIGCADGCGKAGADRVVPNLAETLAPGGWLQIQEMNLSAGRTEHPSAFNEVLQLFEAVLEAGVIGAAKAMSLELPDSIFDRLEERFEDEMLETGATFGTFVVCGQKSLR